MEFDKIPFTKFGTTKDNRLHFRDKETVHAANSNIQLILSQ